MGYLYVGVGGFLGAIFRGCLFSFNESAGTNFPWVTLFINICGSFGFMAIMRLWAIKQNLSEHLRIGITTGFLGAFTTFSTYSLDVVVQIKTGALDLALMYILLTSLGCLGAGLLGDRLVGIFYHAEESLNREGKR